MYELTLVTAPASEPVTTAEAKAHLRVDVSDDDTLIDGLVASAREEFEEINGRSLFSTTWRARLHGWPSDGRIALPRPPLQSVSSVQYTDEDGNTSTFASSNYYVVTDATPGYLALNADADWPSATLRSHGAIEVQFVAGWDDVADIPQRYKQAILMLLGHWYENRETVQTSGAMPKEMPLAFLHLARTDRVWWWW